MSNQPSDNSWNTELEEVLKRDKSLSKSLAVTDVIQRILGPRCSDADTNELSTMLIRVIDTIAEVEQYVLWAIEKQVELRKQEDHNAASRSDSSVSSLAQNMLRSDQF